MLFRSTGALTVTSSAAKATGASLESDNAGLSINSNVTAGNDLEVVRVDDHSNSINVFKNTKPSDIKSAKEATMKAASSKDAGKSSAAAAAAASSDSDAAAAEAAAAPAVDPSAHYPALPFPLTASQASSLARYRRARSHYRASLIDLTSDNYWRVNELRAHIQAWRMWFRRETVNVAAHLRCPNSRSAGTTAPPAGGKAWAPPLMTEAVQLLSRWEELSTPVIPPPELIEAANAASATAASDATKGKGDSSSRSSKKRAATGSTGKELESVNAKKEATVAIDLTPELVKDFDRDRQHILALRALTYAAMRARNQLERSVAFAQAIHRDVSFAEDEIKRGMLGSATFHRSRSAGVTECATTAAFDRAVDACVDALEQRLTARPWQLPHTATVKLQALYQRSGKDRVLDRTQMYGDPVASLPALPQEALYTAARTSGSLRAVGQHSGASAFEVQRTLAIDGAWVKRDLGATAAGETSSRWVFTPPLPLQPPDDWSLSRRATATGFWDAPAVETLLFDPEANSSSASAGLSASASSSGSAAGGASAASVSGPDMVAASSAARGVDIREGV